MSLKKRLKEMIKKITWSGMVPIWSHLKIWKTQTWIPLIVTEILQNNNLTFAIYINPIVWIF